MLQKVPYQPSRMITLQEKKYRMIAVYRSKSVDSSSIPQFPFIGNRTISLAPNINKNQSSNSTVPIPHFNNFGLFPNFYLSRNF